MQLFATYVKNKCTFFNLSVQQKLALHIRMDGVAAKNQKGLCNLFTMS